MASTPGGPDLQVLSDVRYKQLASILGDLLFQSRRRHLFQQVNLLNLTQTWAYEWWGREPTFPPYLGSESY